MRERAEDAGVGDGRGGREVPRRELGVARDAEEPKADAHLVLEQLERPHQARYAGRGERQAAKAADADRVRAERESLDDVGATHEAAIDPDFGFSFYCLDDFREHGGGAQAVVELSPAVV